MNRQEFYALCNHGSWPKTDELILANNILWSARACMTHSDGTTSDPNYFSTVICPQKKENVETHSRRYQALRQKFIALGHKGIELLDSAMQSYTECVGAIGIEALPWVQPLPIEQLEALT